MSNLTVFNFESREVRFVGTPEALEWVAVDVCKILDIANPSDTLADFEDDEKGIAIIDTLGGKQEMLTVKEPGFYRLIFKSRKSLAKRVQRWVFHDVLPTLRKTGKYELSQTEPAQLPTPTVDEIAQLIDLTLGKTDLGKNLVAGVKLNAIARQHPQLALAAEAAKSALSIEVESNLLTPTAVGEKLTTDGKAWSSQRVNKTLIELGLQEKNPAGKNPSYFPTEKGKEYGCLVLDTAKGHDKTVQHLRWYPSVVEALEAVEG